MRRMFQAMADRFQKDRIAFLLETACDFLLLALFIAFPLLSGSYPWNYVSVGVAALFSLAVFAYIFLRSSFVVTLPMALLLWSLVVGAVSTLGFGEGSLDNLQTLAMLTVLASVIGNYSAAFRNGRKCMVLFLAGMTVFALAFLVRYRNEILSLQFDRLGTEFENVNTVGFYMATALAVSLGLVISRRGRWHFLLILAPLFLGIVLLTGSRASFLMAALVLVCAIFLYFGIRRIWLSILILGSLAVFALLALQLPVFATIRDRILSMLTTFLGEGDGSYDYSGVQRLNMMVDGIRIWLKNAFFGRGLGSFAAISAYGTYSHATLTESLVSMGLVGAVPLFLGYLMPMFGYRKERSDAFPIGWMMFVGIFLPGLFLTVLLFSKSFYIVVGILLGEDALKEGALRYSVAFTAHDEDLGRRRLMLTGGLSRGNGAFARCVRL